MMYGMFFLAVVLLIVVFGFMYLAFDHQPAGQEQPAGTAPADSMVLIVEDSLLCE